MSNKPTKKEEYLYISAMLRARENKMLTRDKAERMLDAGSFEEAAKLLSDCGYEDMSQMSAKDVEDVLSRRRASVFTELAALAPNKMIVDLFRVKYDYHNAKAVIKAEAMNTDPLPLMSGAGRIKPEELLAAYTEEHFGEIPGLLGDAMAEAKSVLARSANPQLADFVLDKAYFDELTGITEELGSSYLKGYVAIMADSTNLRSAVRTLRMGKDVDFLRTALVAGGNVSVERIISAASGDSLAALFAGTELAEAASLGSAAAEGGTLTAFELACDNAVMAYVANAKLAAYGEEPVIAYMAAVESEITTVRMILTGRLAGIEPQTIRERLRDMYA